MGKDLSQAKATFFFCDGGSCRKAGSESVVRAARAKLRNDGLWDATHTIKTRCNGRCEDAPTWIVHPGGYWYGEVTPGHALKIINTHTQENQPPAEGIIFRTGQKQVSSNSERPPLKKPSFKPAYSEELGDAYVARGFHSDQYLFPLFLFLQQNPGSAYLALPNGNTFPITHLKNIDYTAPYYANLEFSDEAKPTVKLLIGLLPQDADKALKLEKISVCEYWIAAQTGEKAIKLKNNQGQLVAQIFIAPQDEVIWNYCLQIQLKGVTPPNIAAYEKR